VAYILGATYRTDIALYKCASFTETNWNSTNVRCVHGKESITSIYRCILTTNSILQAEENYLQHLLNNRQKYVIFINALQTHYKIKDSHIVVHIPSQPAKFEDIVFRMNFSQVRRRNVSPFHFPVHILIRVISLLISKLGKGLSYKGLLKFWCNRCVYDRICTPASFCNLSYIQYTYVYIYIYIYIYIYMGGGAFLWVDTPAK